MQVQANFHEGAIIGQREEQQDDKANLILDQAYRLYVLADGMGGQKGGQLASKTVTNAIRDYFHTNSTIRVPENQLRQAVEHANKALSDLLRSRPELNGMGTTLIAVLVNETDNRFTYISIGDSPLYIMRNGLLVRVNANHAFYEDLKKMVAAGEISEEEAREHPARHAITSALMGKKIEHIDVSSGVLQPGELLLLASDGIQTLNDGPQGEIFTILNASKGDLESAVSSLLHAVEQKQEPYQDNTTLVLVRPAPLRSHRLTEPVVHNTVIDSGDTGSLLNTSVSRKHQTLLYSIIGALLLLVMILSVLLFMRAGSPPESDPHTDMQATVEEPLHVPEVSKPAAPKADTSQDADHQVIDNGTEQDKEAGHDVNTSSDDDVQPDQDENEAAGDGDHPDGSGGIVPSEESDLPSEEALNG